MQLLHRAEPLVLAHRHAAQQRFLLLLGERNAQAARKNQLIVQQAIERLRRRFAREAIIERGAQRVDIRPRALALVLVLLNGRKAVLECDGHRLAAERRLARAAKIEQPHTAPLEHQVVGTDVAVNQAGRMHGSQRREQRLHQREQLLRLNAAAALGHKLLEGGAVHIFHHDVSRVVRLKKVPHAHNLALFHHFRHGARFPQEALQAVLIAAGGPRVTGDGKGLFRTARHPVGGEILLHGHLELQPEIEADVRDAEAALTQNAANQIPPQQDRPGRQMMGLRLVCALREAALRAGRVAVSFRHAVGAIAF